MTQQQFNRGVIPQFRSPDQGAPAMRILDPVGIGACLQQGVDDLRMVIACSLHERCVPALVTEIDHGSRLQQLLDNSEVSLLRRLDEWGEETDIPCIDINPVLQDPADMRLVTLLRSNEQLLFEPLRIIAVTAGCQGKNKEECQVILHAGFSETVRRGSDYH